MKDSIRKYLGIISILTLFLLPIGSFKPNRVFSGSDFYAWDIFTYEYLIILFILIMVVFSQLNKRFQLLNISYNLVLILFPIYLIYLIQTYQFAGEYDVSTARISMHVSSYLSIIGIYLLMSTLSFPKIKIFISIFGVIFAFTFGMYTMLGISKEFINRRETFNIEIIRHLSLSLSSLLFAIIPSLYLGYQSTKHAKLREWIMGIINGFQVAPTLSLLALMMIPLSYLSQEFPFLRSIGITGIGFFPSFIILTLYALLPITSNTYTGFMQIDSSILDSAKALGLSRLQILFKVSFPLALPVILSGIRTALTQNIGNTILAGLVGGGGLGSIIFLGLSQSASDLILLGSIPVVFMALFSDVVLETVELMVSQKIGILN
jgi:osmoprotectant transport system permease protein